jgi:hypothetical protein
MKRRDRAVRFQPLLAVFFVPAVLSGQAALTPVIQVNATSEGYQAPSTVAIDERGRALFDYRDAGGLYPIQQVGRFLELDSTMSAEFALGQEWEISGTEVHHLPSGGWLFNSYASPPHPLPGPVFRFLGEDGSPIGGPISIHSETIRASGAALATDSAGELFVGFVGRPRANPDAYLEMYFERFSAAGARVVEPVPLTQTPLTDETFSGRIGVDSQGRSLVSWGEWHGVEDDYDVRARLVDRMGNFLTPRFTVHSTVPGLQAGPSGVAAVAGDRFVVVWEGESPASPYHDVYFRIFAANGTPVTGDIPVSTAPTGARYSGSIASAGGSRFVVAWSSDGQDGFSEEIYFRVFRADGTPASDEIRATAGAGREGWEDSWPFVALSKSGVIALTWTAGNFDIDSMGVAARKYFRGCAEGAPRLVLGGGRFEVCAIWSSFSGARGAGVPVPLTGDTGGFWFFGPENLELIVKILDGCGTNQSFWLYAAGLTNVEVTLGIVDTWTGRTWIRDTDLATPFPPIQDIEAFDACGASPPVAPAEGSAAVASPAGRRPSLLPADSAIAGLCVADSTHACLQGGRFRVSASYATRSGQAGEAIVFPLGAESAALWFFEEANLELFVKVIDACAEFDRFWVFSAGLTNLFVRLRVEDTVSGEVELYENPLDRAYQPILDLGRFDTCS